MMTRTPEEWIQYAHDHIHEVLADAIRWQQHVQEEWEELRWMQDDPVDWYMDTFAEARIEARKLVPAIAAMRAARAWRDARATYGPVHQVRASPTWPAVAVPGEPGRWLEYREAA